MNAAACAVRQSTARLDAVPTSTFSPGMKPDCRLACSRVTVSVGKLFRGDVPAQESDLFALVEGRSGRELQLRRVQPRFGRNAHFRDGEALGVEARSTNRTASWSASLRRSLGSDGVAPRAAWNCSSQCWSETINPSATAPTMAAAATGRGTRRERPHRTGAASRPRRARAPRFSGTFTAALCASATAPLLLGRRSAGSGDHRDPFLSKARRDDLPAAIRPQPPTRRPPQPASSRETRSPVARHLER